MSLFVDIFFAKCIPSELSTCSADFEEIIDVRRGNTSVRIADREIYDTVEDDLHDDAGSQGRITRDRVAETCPVLDS